MSVYFENTQKNVLIIKVFLFSSSNCKYFLIILGFFNANSGSDYYVVDPFY